MHLKRCGGTSSWKQWQTRLIVLLLTDVNRDQEEALIQMKFPRAQTPALFSQIDASKGCDHLVRSTPAKDATTLSDGRQQRM